MGGFAGGLESSLRLGMALTRQRDADRYRQEALDFNRKQLDQRVKEHEDRVAQWDTQNEAAVRQDFIASYQAGSSRIAAEASRSQAETARGTLDLERQQYNDKQVGAGKDEYISGVFSKNFFDIQNGQVDVDALSAALMAPPEQRDSQVETLVLQGLNSSAIVPEGFTFNSVERKNGQFIFSGNYKEDGRPGVLTATGGVSDDSALPPLDGRLVAGLIRDSFYQAVKGSELGSDGLTRYVLHLKGNEAAARDAAANAEATGTVLDQLDLNTEASRAFRGALAKATDENERRATLRDFASTNLNMQLELPDAAPATEIIGSVTESNLDERVPVAVMGGPASGFGGPASQVLMSDSPAAVERRVASRRATRIDSQIADLERKAEQASGPRKEALMTQITELDAERQELVQRTNTQSLEAATARIKDLTAKRDKARGPRQAYWQEQIDAATQEKRELERGMGVVTPAMETNAYKRLEEDVFSRLEELSNDEIQDLAAKGQLTFSPEQLSVLRQRAQELGGTVEDIRTKATPPEQAAYLALLSSMARTPGEVTQSGTELRNVRETGVPSMSAKDLGEARLRGREARTAEGRLDLDRKTQATQDFSGLDQFRQDEGKKVNDIFFEEAADGTTVLRSGMNAPREYLMKVFPSQFSRYQDFKRRQDVDPAAAEKARVIKDEARRGLSIAINRMSGASPSAWRAVLNFFGGRPGADYTATGMDFDLDRIQIGEYAADGRPKSFIFTTAGGGRAGEPIPARTVEQLGKPIYNALVQAAKANETSR